jgi:hypothetical protein
LEGAAVCFRQLILSEAEYRNCGIHFHQWFSRNKHQYYVVRSKFTLKYYFRILRGL